MVEIKNLTKKPTPKIDWEKVKSSILGEKHEVSVVLASGQLMKKLNKQYRQKTYEADTLSFNISKDSGEIFLNAKNKPENMLFLYIHSLLHLKNMEHGKEMDKLEKKYLKKFHSLLKIL